MKSAIRLVAIQTGQAFEVTNVGTQFNRMDISPEIKGNVFLYSF